MASDRSSSNDRVSSRRGRLRDYGLLALTALPAVVLAVVGLGYLRYEAAIAERELNEGARRLAGRLANRLNQGFEDYRQSEGVRLRTLSTLNFFSTDTPKPWDSAANREAFEVYEQALDAGEEARVTLEGRLASFDGKHTPAGLPLKPLTEYHLVRLASEAGDEVAVTKWLAVLLESAIERQPSAISSTLVDRAADFAEKHDCGEAVGLAKWRERWEQSNRTRELVRRHWETLRSNINANQWFADGGEDYYWDIRESNESVVYSKSELEALAGELGLDLIREGVGRRYPLAVRITFGTWAFEDLVPAPLNDRAQREAWFQRLGFSPIMHSHSGRQLADAGAGPFGVRVASADPEAFSGAVRRRAMLQGGFLIAVIACLGAGVWLTWRAMQTQRRLNARQADFISSVSHELRAPVAGIRLLSERLAKDADDGSRRAEYVDLIDREASRLGTLVANVLDVTRIGQGRKTYQFEPADIGALVRDTVERMRPLAEERGISMAMEIETLREDPSVDAVALQQALGNLIDNAIKFSPDGGTIEVSLKPQREKERGFVVAVVDQGSGIENEEQSRIFERFYRVGSELQRETAGAGIGLNLVRHIAESHDGSVSVESVPGEGARFELRIPR